MTRAEFFAEFEKIVEAPSGSVSETTVLSSLAGWDSMATISFLAMVDKHFSVVLSPGALAACTTVGDLAGLVADKLGG